MTQSVVIIGAGGHAKVIADCIVASGDRVVGFLDDKLRRTSTVIGFPVLGKVADAVHYQDHVFVLAIGHNQTRKRLAERYPLLSYYTAIHPTAVRGLDVTVEEGTVVLAHAVLNPTTTIGKHCIVNTGAIVEHDNVIEDFAHISPGAALGGTVTVGTLTHIGIGASVRNNITIASECLIGAGAVVVHDIVDKGVYGGIPAIKLQQTTRDD